MSANVAVAVPGSTANLGSGFDCVAIAVERWVHVTARRAPGGSAMRFERHGVLAALSGPDAEDLLYRGFVRACEAAGAAPPAVVLDARSDIPIGRGLGSSAAAVVAGAATARVLCDLSLDDAALIALCAEIEGHPDNVAASVRGGAILVLGAPGGSGWQVAPLEVHASLALVFAVPEFTLSTERARAALPPTVPHHTAAQAVARSAALVLGLARADAGLLAAGLDDLLHVPARRALVRGYDEVTAAAHQAGAFGATLSGSGPALVAVASAARAAAVEAGMAEAWRSLGVSVATFRGTAAVGGCRVA